MLNKKKTIIFPLEVKNREFNYTIMIINEALKNNFKCIIGRRDYIYPIFKYFPKSIFFLKSLTLGDEPMVKKLKKNGHLITSLDVESLVPINVKNWTLRRYSEICIKLADKIFFINKNHFRDFSNSFKNRFSKKKTKIVGSPMISNWIFNFKNKKINSKKKRILIISSFGYANTLIGKANYQASLRNIKPYKFKTYDQIKNYKFVKKILDYNKKYHTKFFKKFYDMVDNLAMMLKDYEILIRPHPSENKDDWSLLKRKYKNVTIDDSSNISDLILGSSSIIHSNSTGAIEAFFYKKNIIMYNDIKKYPLSANKINLNISHQTYSINKVVKLIKSKRKNYNYNDQNLHLAPKKIINEIKKLNIKETKKLFFFNSENDLFLNIIKFYNYLKRFILVPILSNFPFEYIKYKFSHGKDIWKFGYKKIKKSKWNEFNEKELIKSISFYSKNKFHNKNLKIKKNLMGFFIIENK